MTWRDLIKLSLQGLRVYGASGNPSPEDEAIALAHLNDWIDSQKNDFGAVYEIRRTLWTLTAAASYAVGSGAAVDVQRPVSPQMIAGVGFVNNNLTGAPEYAVNPPLNPTEWQRINYKTFQAPYPARFYYEATVATGTLYPYPIPTTGSLQGVMYSAVQVEEIAVITATIALPPGYRRWLRLALKIELVDVFKVPIDEARLERWTTQRDEAAALARRQNERLEEVSFGVAGAMFGRGGARSNIYTGLS